MSNELKFKELFESRRWESSFRPALHMEWDELGEHASELLSALLGRPIYVEVIRGDYYYWHLDITNTPVSEEEMELLFLAADADDRDQEIDDFDKYPITELSQELSRKLISRTLPFLAWTSFADDEGIWFVGSEISAENEKEHVDILVSYPETDFTPDLVRFIISSDTEKRTVMDAFINALQAYADDKDTDCLSRLDAAIEAVKNKFSCTCECVNITFEGKVW